MVKRKNGVAEPYHIALATVTFFKAGFSQTMNSRHDRIDNTPMSVAHEAQDPF